MSQEILQKLSSDWGNYWQGRTGESTGQALVGIENNPEIQTFWNNCLDNIPKNQSILDLACGAGTVVKILLSQSFSDVSGVDIAEQAIQILTTEFSDVQGFVAPLEDLPFENESYNLIVSQFGFEYGDIEKVIPEVARVLKPGGRFLSLSHKEGGAIHQEVSLKHTQMQALKDVNFFPIARELFRVAIGGVATRDSDTIIADFRVKRQELEEIVKEQGGLARHLLDGSRIMFERRQNYQLQDVLGWLEGMEHEIHSFIGRMQSMENAAIDDEKMTTIEARFEKLGFVMEPRSFLKGDNGSTLGWIIAGHKT